MKQLLRWYIIPVLVPPKLSDSFWLAWARPVSSKLVWTCLGSSGLVQLVRAHPGSSGSFRLVRAYLGSSSSSGLVLARLNSSGFVWLVQAYLGASGLVRARPGSSGLVQAPLGSSGLVQARPGLSRLIQAFWAHPGPGWAPGQAPVLHQHLDVSPGLPKNLSKSALPP